MKTDKTSINQSLKLFGIGRTTLYKHLKNLNISPQKHKNCSYLTNTQIAEIKGFLSNAVRGEQLKVNANEQANSSEQQKNIIKQLTQELNNQKKIIFEEKAENKILISKLGESKGRSDTLEEQNNKLFFKLGSIAEKVAQLENDNSKLIELSTTPKNTKTLNFLGRLNDFFKK